MLPVGFLRLLLHGRPLPLQIRQSLLALRQIALQLLGPGTCLGDFLRLRLLLATQRFKFGQQLLAPDF